MNPRRILVTGTGGPLGSNLTRSLRAAPEKLALFGTEANRYHLPLSLSDRTFLIPHSRDTDAYLAALARIVADEGIDLILPTHPVEVRTIASHRRELGPVRLFLPATACILAADSKWETFRILRAAGIPVPDTFSIDREDDVRAAFAAIPTRPVWVRGSGAPGIGIGVASLPCREAAHAVAWIDHYRGWGGFIASRFLPGRNLTWCGLFQEGRLLAAQTRERLEYVIPHVSPSGITGAPAVSRTIAYPQVRSTGEAAVRALPGTPHGIFFVDMTEDEAGQPRVTEINAGRFGTTIHFYTEAGCNFPYLAVQLAFGENIAGAPFIDPIPPGVYWLRTLDCGPVLARDLDGPGK
ncbi:MAG TPA: hypothetical protein VF518_05360 [Polyangia bacterium]